MALDVDALRTSFTLVVEREPELGNRFYNIFFSRYPQVKPLFGRHSGPEQQKMLTEMLVAVLEHIEDAPWLEQNLKGLGARHVQYEVTREMYAWVGECLVAAMAEVAGEDWTEHYENAWLDAYQAITDLTLAGYPAEAR